MKSLEEQYKALKFMIDNDIDSDPKKCKENYLTRVLFNLVSMARDVNQTEEFSEITKCRRVIKVRRLNVPIEIMRKTHPEIMVFEGVCLIADGLFIPKKVMTEIGYDTFSKKWGRLDVSSLPDGYAYSTIRDIGNGCGFVLKKSDISEGLYNRASAWEYFNLSDYVY